MQVRSIMGQVRADRQTLLFSATMPNKVERLVSDCLTAPVRVTVGEVGAANADIRQAGDPGAPPKIWNVAAFCCPEWPHNAPGGTKA